MNYFKKRKIRKNAHDVLRHSKHIRHMREDIMTEKELNLLQECEDTLRGHIDAHDYEKAETASTKLYKKSSALIPVKPFAAFAENLEVVVVALAVAMAVKAYFIQPFKIPTSSMSPTLYGIELDTDYKPGLFDTEPLKRVKWLASGRMYKKIVVKKSGKMSEWFDVSNGLGGNNNPVYKFVDIAGIKYKLPERADSPYSPGQTVDEGSVLWEGVMISGDHVFVDKVSWNFRKPKRGEIMVFRTKGISGIDRGDHYIKRLVGMPGESIKIDNSTLLANGVKIDGPETITRIMNRIPPYINGYTYNGSSEFMHDWTFSVPTNGYMAMGDNSAHSADSRYWGPVPEENMMGPAILVYWPFWPFNKHWGLANR